MASRIAVWTKWWRRWRDSRKKKSRMSPLNSLIRRVRRLSGSAKTERQKGVAQRRSTKPSRKDVTQRRYTGAPMIVGVPREIKTAENRVALVPAGVESLVGDGHSVLVEQGAGIGSGVVDETYRAGGATLVPKGADVWAKAQMVVKVKEPIEPEWPCMRKGQVVFTYFHFAASEPLTRAVIKSGIVAIAYETVQLTSGELPLLPPMSEGPGRMAVPGGGKDLEKGYGGRGIRLGGVPGVLQA